MSEPVRGTRMPVFRNRYRSLHALLVDSARIYDSPQEDYTRRLLAAIPVPVPRAVRSR